MDFYGQVALMRRLQNKFYKTKDKKYLVAAKQAEKNVDETLHANGQQTVFKEDQDEQSKLF